MKYTLKEIQENLKKVELGTESKNAYVLTIRGHFLRFFCSIFKNYQLYFNKSNDKDPSKIAEDTLTSNFDRNLFIKKESDKYDFYEDLFNTRAWILFLENKLYASTKDYFSNKGRKDSKRINNKEKTCEDTGHTESDPINVPDTFSLDYQSIYNKDCSKEEDTSYNTEFIHNGNIEYLNCIYFKLKDSCGISIRNYVEIVEAREIPKFAYLVFPGFSECGIPIESSFDKGRFALNLCAKDEIIQKNDKILKMLDQIQSRNGAQHIMVSWILLWCLSFKYLQSIEKKVRLDELLTVLQKLFNENNYDKSNIVFMEYILQTILEYGRLEHMNSLFETISLCNISISISMKQYYFKCVDKEEKIKRNKHNVKSKKMSFIREERKASVSVTGFKDKDRDKEKKFIESIRKSGKLRRRTLKNYEQRRNLLIEEVVSFEIPGRCLSCGKISDYEQIFQTIDCEGSFKCFFCGIDQILTLYVCVGNKNDIEDVKTSISSECTLSSEVEIIANIKHLYDTSVHKNDSNNQKFDLMILREHRENVLWNCILFFYQRHKLPYDFLLPFEDCELKYQYDKNHESLLVKEVDDINEI